MDWTIAKLEDYNPRNREWICEKEVIKRESSVITTFNGFSYVSFPHNRLEVRRGKARKVFLLHIHIEFGFR